MLSNNLQQWATRSSTTNQTDPMNTLNNAMTRLTILALCSFVVGSAWRVPAQELDLVVAPPLVGTYYLLSFELEGKRSPPYPFDPYEGTLPVYQLKGFPNSYLVADSPEDYLNLRRRKAMQACSAEDGEVILEGDGPPPPPGGGGGGGGGSGGDWPPPMYLTSTNLCLLPPVVTGTNTLVLTLTNAGAGAVYDLLATTNLVALAMPALSLTNWVWLLRTASGQTNIVLSNLWSDVGFFLLGTLADADDDGLTDVLERLVFHTDSENADTDGDGLADGWEVAQGYNPATADTNQNGLPDGYEDADGDGLANLVEPGFAGHPTVFSLAWRLDADGDGVPDSVDGTPGAADAPPFVAGFAPCPLP